SEQLPTRLWLATDDDNAAGLLLQVMPQRERDPDAWQHVTVLADTVTDAELKTLSAEHLLHRLYHEDDLRLFETAPVSFRCQCSRERIEATLRGLGAEEVRGILSEQGKVHVDCEFCGRGYDLDSVDIEALFTAAAQQPVSDMRH
ncbi:MAG: Hsp33 family molecular chaperone HslO, partial [Gammaproteobacteria bacterium]